MRHYVNGAWTKEGDANCWKRVTYEKRQPGTFHISKPILSQVNYMYIMTPDRSIFQYDTIYPNRLYFTRDGVIWVSGNRHFHLTNCIRTGDDLQFPIFPGLDPYVHNRNGHLLMRKITRLELMFS
jgi:hypothetical protein